MKEAFRAPSAGRLGFYLNGGDGVRCFSKMLENEVPQSKTAQRIELIYEAAESLGNQGEPGWAELDSGGRASWVAAVEDGLANPGNANGKLEQVQDLREALASFGLLKPEEEAPPPPPAPPRVDAGLEDGIPPPGEEAAPVPGTPDPEPEPEPAPFTIRYVDMISLGSQLGNVASQASQAGIKWREMNDLWSRETHGKRLVQLTVPSDASVPPSLAQHLLPAEFDPGIEPGARPTDLPKSTGSHITVGSERSLTPGVGTTEEMRKQMLEANGRG
jgi:hypothetical protein